MQHQQLSRRRFFVPTLLAILFLQACTTDAPPPAAAPEVAFLTIQAESVSINSAFPGRINPVRSAEVRARATGILLKRVFEEGAQVQAGQLLFEIDPAPLEATVAGAKATLAKATSTLQRSKAQAARYKELIAIDAVSRSDYEEALATLAQNEADILAAKAALTTAELNLGYAKVTAPIAGRIGRAMVTEGTLVSAAEATRLAVIHQLDPVYFDFTQSSVEVLQLKRALESGAFKSVAPGEARLTLKLEDGSPYPVPGRLLFSDISVDETTGMITLRAEFPNKDRILLPGMFARGVLEQAVDTAAITVPQRALTRGVGGTASVLLVNQENKTEIRSVKVGSAVDDRWIITAGLTGGERIVMEGSQKAPPGTVVIPVPFISAPASSPALPANTPEMK